MKLFIGLLVSVLIFGFAERPALAQVSYGAKAYAEQQQQEERWRKLSAQMEELLASQEVLRKKIQTLEEENRRLSKELNQSGTAYVTPAQLDKVAKDLNDKIYQVDKNREADQQTIKQEMDRAFDRLQSTIKSQVVSSPPTRAPVAATEFYTHTIQSGQTISAVVQAFRAQGIEVSTSDVLKANPGLDPKRLQVGQVIKIPKP